MTNRYLHDKKRALVAWWLLAVFTLPLIICTFHVCQIGNEFEGTGTVVYPAQHSAGHHADTCPICHFSFFSFLKPVSVHVEAIALTCIVGILLFTTVGFYCTTSETHGLRAPPALAMV